MSAGSSRRAPGWSRNAWSASAFSREKNAASNASVAPPLSKTTRSNLNWLWTPGKTRISLSNLTSVRSRHWSSISRRKPGRALGLVQAARHHHADRLPLAGELPGPFEEELEQVGITSGGLPLDRDFAVVPSISSSTSAVWWA